MFDKIFIGGIKLYSIDKPNQQTKVIIDSLSKFSTQIMDKEEILNSIKDEEIKLEMAGILNSQATQVQIPNMFFVRYERNKWLVTTPHDEDKIFFAHFMKILPWDVGDEIELDSTEFISKIDDTWHQAQCELDRRHNSIITSKRQYEEKVLEESLSRLKQKYGTKLPVTLGSILGVSGICCEVWWEISDETAIFREGSEEIMDKVYKPYDLKRKSVYDEEQGIDQLKWYLGYTCSICSEKMTSTFDFKPSKDDIVSVLIVPCQRCAEQYNEEEMEKIEKLELFMVKCIDEEYKLSSD